MENLNSIQITGYKPQIPKFKLKPEGTKNNLWWPPNHGVLYKGEQKLTKEKLLKETGMVNSEPSLKQQEALKKATKDFESFFTYYLLKVMDKTISRDKGLFRDSLAAKFYREMLYENLAEHISQRGIGIKDFMYDQLKQSLINKVYK